MSKFIIILCLAVFAVATHAASIENPNSLDEMKEECVDAINRAFKVYENLWTHDEGSAILEKLINQVREEKSLELPEEPKHIFGDFSFKCSKKVTDEMNSLIWDSLISSGAVVVP